MADNENRSSRIPEALQAVFLASNRGHAVHRPPPKKLAYKVFFCSWFTQRYSLATQRNKCTKTHGKHSGTEKKLEVLNDQMEFLNVPSRIHVRDPCISTPLSPQEYLETILQSRGYSTKQYKTLQTAYYAKPTRLQQESYGVRVIDLVRKKDIDGLRELLAAGISPNPCNAYGESLVHMICRRGEDALLSLLLDFGCSVQVADDYGRTPLHDACWAPEPSFATVELILGRDLNLLRMVDSRGSSPLAYVRKENWDQWRKFLDAKKDEFWKPRACMELDPHLVLSGPNSRPIMDPDFALTPELAAMASSGKLRPDEAQFLMYDSTGDEYDSDDDSEVDCDDDDASDSSDDLDSVSVESDDSDLSLDEEEMAEILNSFVGPRKQAIVWSH